MTSRSGLATLSLAATLAACSQPPERIETLDQARTAVQAIEEDPLARDVAQTRYEAARAALSRAEEAYDENEDVEIIEHEAYTALRNAQIVQAETDERRGREALEDSEAERNRVLLQAREREAAQATELAAERGRELEAQSREAQEAEQRAAELAEERQGLEQQLAELQAEQTERGWVMTLSDVLFDFDRAELNPGAAATIDRLARFLEENPDRNIAIEGHTDASGTASYNRELSRQRAEAVRQALVDRGIASSRIEIRALGEEFPVATNDTDAGRQLNRRVEIVLSDPGGRFEGEQRTASEEPTEQEG
ncbi:MAG TPA: OmpA family protein [Gammaproteobacteria bacterium]